MAPQQKNGTRYLRVSRVMAPIYLEHICILYGTNNVCHGNMFGVRV